MVNKNIKNLNHCEKEVTKIQKTLESAKKNQVIKTSISDDVKLFFKLAKNNQLDLLESEDIKKKLSEFKKKIKSKYEIISVFSNKDLLKVKKLLIKNAS